MPGQMPGGGGPLGTGGGTGGLTGDSWDHGSRQGRSLAVFAVGACKQDSHGLTVS